MTAELANEAEVAKRAVLGDRAAFAALVKRHQGTVYRIALRILRDEGDANDAAQEAFLKAFRNLSSFDSTRPFAPWLYRIARNHSLDVARHKGASPEELERADRDEEDEGVGAVGRDVADADAGDALSMLEGAEAKRRIGDALGKLDAKYREVVELYHFEGLTYDEIATMLNVPIGTVMTRLFREREAPLPVLITRRVAIAGLSAGTALLGAGAALVYGGGGGAHLPGVASHFASTLADAAGSAHLVLTVLRAGAPVLVAGAVASLAIVVPIFWKTLSSLQPNAIRASART